MTHLRDAKHLLFKKISTTKKLFTFIVKPTPNNRFVYHRIEFSVIYLSFAFRKNIPTNGSADPLKDRLLNN